MCHTRWHKLLFCVAFKLSDLKRKIRTSDLRISSPAHYHLSYPGSHDSSCSNLPPETDATFTRRCGHDICHLLTTSELTSLFTWIWYSNQIINWKQTHNLCIWIFTLSDLKRKIKCEGKKRCHDLISNPLYIYLSKTFCYLPVRWSPLEGCKQQTCVCVVVCVLFG